MVLGGDSFRVGIDHNWGGQCLYTASELVICTGGLQLGSALDCSLGVGGTDSGWDTLVVAYLWGLQCPSRTSLLPHSIGC